MSALAEFRSFNREQRAAFVASFLGWTLDAFDFFVLVFVVKAIADDFHTEVKAVSFAILVTLAMRPLGAFVFGRLADRYGRKPVLMLDVCLFSAALLAAGAFVMQFMVQGAWGIVPAHLNELSPPEVRGTFPGVTYQLGNLFASANAVLQAQIAVSHGGNYGLALALVAGSVAIVLAILASLGPEGRGKELHRSRPALPSP